MSEPEAPAAGLPLKVSAERWKHAQEWEAAYWRAQNLHSPGTVAARLHSAVNAAFGRPTTNPGDDWNAWWAKQFQGYQVLPTRLANAIELGCGPYTNIRLIAQDRRIDHLWCSDPLVGQYLTFEGRWLAQAWKRGEVFVDDHPLEECPFASDYFDLVVLINVLDHVRDGLSCLHQAVRITRPGGYLVLGQDLTDEEDHKRVGEDVGHPIRLQHTVLDTQLLAEFQPVLHRILTREEGRNPAAHYGTYLFVGSKCRRSCACGPTALAAGTEEPSEPEGPPQTA